MADPTNELQSLARLQRVELRKVWLNEATHFPPWPAQEDNLKLLGDTIGLDLELQAAEKNVGPFRADLLCRDTGAGTLVLIENQLARTDHTHLGQLMTYAAGLDAVTIVWLAERFTDEHRAALDWLNEVTSEKINLFGLEVELWRIGDSPIAPKFNIVSKPNDWLKAGAAAGRSGLSEAKAMQAEFWVGFREFATARGSFIKPTKPLPQNWMNISIGRTGFRLVAIASMWDSESATYESHELRTELVIDDEDADAHYLALEAEKQPIENALGEPLTWHRPGNTHARKMYLRRKADLQSRKDWPDYHAWLLARLEKLHRVFAPRVRALGAPSD